MCVCVGAYIVEEALVDWNTHLKASLSKFTSLSDNDGIWTTMVLYKWKLNSQGQFFDFFLVGVMTLDGKLKISPLWINFYSYKTIVFQMPSLLDNNGIWTTMPYMHFGIHKCLLPYFLRAFFHNFRNSLSITLSYSKRPNPGPLAAT